MRVHAVALGLLLASTSARADDRPPPKKSYALQTVLVETAGAAFVIRAFFTQSPLMLGTGTAMWALGGAAVHVAHGNGVAAVISPVIMVGVPAAFFGAGYGLGSGRERSELGAMVGTLGVLIAPGVDATLARAEPGEGDDQLAVRLGVGVGRVRWRNARAPASPSVVDAGAYLGTSFELAIGARVGAWTIGAMALEHVVALNRRDWKATHPLGGDVGFNLFSVGPWVEWHRDRKGGPWAGGMLGLAQLSGAEDEDRPFGLSTSLSGGWDVPFTRTWSFAPALRVTYARLSSDRYGGSPVDVFSPMFLLGASRR